MTRVRPGLLSVLRVSFVFCSLSLGPGSRGEGTLPLAEAGLASRGVEVPAYGAGFGNVGFGAGFGGFGAGFGGYGGF